MRFVYEYRTRENELKRGEIAASERNAAFARLKELGIRPARLEEAPGFFNKLFGKGKRWMTIALLSVALAVSLYLLFRAEPILALDRSQVYGDPEILKRNDDTGWREVFSDPGERILAAFARPGRGIAVELMPPKRGAGEFFAMFGAQLEKSLAHEVEFRENEPNEVVLMKRIVLGMKDELREYLADGGSGASYFERLIDRQREEIAIRNRTATEIGLLRPGDPTAAQTVMEKNADLRTMGIEPISR